VKKIVTGKKSYELRELSGEWFSGRASWSSGLEAGWSAFFWRLVLAASDAQGIRAWSRASFSDKLKCQSTPPLVDSGNG
jgi:hypothetical protein